MMNLSLQMSNPKFLSEDFTTQFDLTTGKLYYESPWGRLFAMMPPEIADAISQAIWRDVFSDRVLKIARPLKISLEGEDHSDYWRARIRNNIYRPKHGQSEVMIKARLDIANKGDCFVEKSCFTKPLCCCLNKSGQICGQIAHNPKNFFTYPEDPEEPDVIEVPQYTMGMRKKRQGQNKYSDGRPSDRSQITIPMCAKHKKEYDKATCPTQYVNDMLKRYGWGERHGYPIRLNTNRLKPSKALENKMAKRCGNTAENRKIIRDEVVGTLDGIYGTGKRNSWISHHEFIHDPNRKNLYTL